MGFAKSRTQDLMVSTVALILALAVFLPTRAGAYETPYESTFHAARMSETLGGTFVLGKDDIEWSHAEPNLVVEKGDLLQTDEAGMAEVQFDGMGILRIGERSRIAILELDQTKVIGMDSGKAYLRVTGRNNAHKEFALTFPSGQISTTGMALVRIDILEDGRAEVAVIRGSIYLETASETATVVESGERVLINSQGLSEYLPLEFARRDDFGAWSEERDVALSMYRRPAYLEEDIVGAEDLEDYGEWVYADDYNVYAWQPYVVEDWQPYFYGRWYDSPYFGSTWIPEEPWGYVTHHYGSWNYDHYYGWIWLPGYTWRPAHVHWVASGDYFGWVPIGYYGYPVITTYPYYVRTINITYVHYNSFSFAHRRYFHKGHKHHHRFAKHRQGERDRDGRRDDREFNRGDRLDRKRFEFGGRHHVGLDKIKRGKIRHIANIRSEKLAKTFRKGKAERPGRIRTHEEILDLRKNPKLRRKVDKLAKRRVWADNRRTTVRSDELPKKLEKDRMKEFDFRTRPRLRFPNDSQSGPDIRKRHLERKTIRRETPTEQKKKYMEKAVRYRTPQDRPRRDIGTGSARPAPTRTKRIEVLRTPKRNREVKMRPVVPSVRSEKPSGFKAPQPVLRRSDRAKDQERSAFDRKKRIKRETPVRTTQDLRRADRKSGKKLDDVPARVEKERADSSRLKRARVARVEQRPIRQERQIEFRAESKPREVPEKAFSSRNDRPSKRSHSEGRGSRKTSGKSFQNRR